MLCSFLLCSKAISYTNVYILFRFPSHVGHWVEFWVFFKWALHISTWLLCVDVHFECQVIVKARDRERESLHLDIKTCDASSWIVKLEGPWTDGIGGPQLHTLHTWACGRVPCLHPMDGVCLSPGGCFLAFFWVLNYRLHSSLDSSSWKPLWHPFSLTDYFKTFSV